MPKAACVARFAWVSSLQEPGVAGTNYPVGGQSNNVPIPASANETTAAGSTNGNSVDIQCAPWLLAALSNNDVAFEMLKFSCMWRAINH